MTWCTTVWPHSEKLNMKSITCMMTMLTQKLQMHSEKMLQRGVENIGTVQWNAFSEEIYISCLASNHYRKIISNEHTNDRTKMKAMMQLR